MTCSSVRRCPCASVFQEIPMQTHAFPYPHFKFAAVCAAAVLLACAQPSQAASPKVEFISTNAGKAATAPHPNLRRQNVYQRRGLSPDQLDGATRPHCSGGSKGPGLRLEDDKPDRMVRKTVGQFARNLYRFIRSEVARAAAIQITFLSGLHAHCEEATSTHSES